MTRPKQQRSGPGGPAVPIQVSVSDLWAGRSFDNGLLVPDSSWEPGITVEEVRALEAGEITTLDPPLPARGTDAELDYHFDSVRHWRSRLRAAVLSVDAIRAKRIEDVWWIEDGFHRLAAARVEEIPHLWVLPPKWNK